MLVTFSLIILLLDVCISVDITVTSPVIFSESNLEIECRPANGGSDLNEVDVLQFYKNSSGTLGDSASRIVSVTFSREDFRSVINWQDSDLRNRSSATGSVNSAGSAFLTLTINSSDVICADEAAYRCEMIAKDLSNAGISETNDVFIEITSNPSIIALTASSSSGEPLPDSNIVFYEANTTLSLTCNLTVGKPPIGVKWCIKTSNDTDFMLYQDPDDAITSNATFQEDICQFRRTTTLTYLVGEDEFTTFLCEDDSNTTCGRGFVQATLTVTSERTNPTEQTTMNSDVTTDVTNDLITDVTQETTDLLTDETSIVTVSSDVISTFTSEFQTDMIQSTTDTGQEDVTSSWTKDTSDMSTVGNMDITSTTGSSIGMTPDFTDFTTDTSFDSTPIETTDIGINSTTAESNTDMESSSTTFSSISDNKTTYTDIDIITTTISSSNMKTLSSAYSTDTPSSTLSDVSTDGTENSTLMSTGNVDTKNSETSSTLSTPTVTESEEVGQSNITISESEHSASTFTSVVTSGMETTTTSAQKTNSTQASSTPILLSTSASDTISTETSVTASSSSSSYTSATTSPIIQSSSSITPPTSPITPPTSSVTPPTSSVTPPTPTIPAQTTTIIPPTSMSQSTSEGSLNGTTESPASQRSLAYLPKIDSKMMVVCILNSLIFFAF